jgi:predicted secreted protein
MSEAQIERPYTGLTALIKIGDVKLAYISGVDLTLEKTIIEILQFGARYKEKVPAIKDWSASVDGTVALAPGGSQHKLYDAFENDEEITVGIFLNDFVYFEGKAYVENFNLSGSPDGEMTLSCDMAGNGAMILNLPTTYRITANSGVGGTCTPGGTTQVAANGTYVLSIIPAANYEVDTLYDNDEDKTDQVNSGTYSLTNVVKDHTISIIFKTSVGADKSNLRAALNYANTLDQSKYTSTTWSQLNIAATAASTVNGNTAATQEAVDTALTNLQTAIGNLQKA